jgi:hypothetical protein
MTEEEYQRIAKVLNPGMHKLYLRKANHEEVDAFCAQVADQLGVSDEDVTAAVLRRGKELQRKARLSLALAKQIRLHAKQHNGFGPAEIERYLPAIQRQVPDATFEEVLELHVSKLAEFRAKEAAANDDDA